MAIYKLENDKIVGIPETTFTNEKIDERSDLQQYLLNSINVIEPELFIQVLVGLEFDNQDILFAKILISRDKDAPFCHILWKDSE
ncbi:hypothetical protein LCGC14_2631120 [marine sediment metagenome]|uniref:DUF440 family protein n=1 Tax=marine sediment metagenome TaxID=412755 RepID=A0A0F9CSQ3_9ZZZZ